MTKNAVNQIAEQIITFYNEYDLRISGKINDQIAYQLIETIEKKYQTDLIRLSDGTRIWNLIRIFLYSNFQSLSGQTSTTKLSKTNIKSVLTIFKESLRSIHIPKDITIYGFSRGESRKLLNDTYYDIYLDPLYEILGDNLVVFEWPENSGLRRKYNRPIYSKHYIPIHFPFTSKTFWNLLIHQLTGHRNFSIQSEEVLKEIIHFISTKASVDKEKLTKDIYDFITVFVYVKEFLYKLLKTNHPKAVLIRCGYGRFPMALSQACRQLGIPSIELQHGLITTYLPAYRRASETTNKDCVPEYLLTHGELYAEIVRNGHLFDREKVISTGYPYLQQTLTVKKRTEVPRQSYSSFPKNILITSQWIVGAEIQDFVVKVAQQLEQENLAIGILFKPHPFDKNNYSVLKKYKHIILIDKYEDTFKLFNIADIHSTVYSTSGLEAMAFSVPNIFIDINHIVHIPDTPYIVSTPDQFMSSIQTILSNYADATKETKAVADLFFTPDSYKHFTEFFNTMNLL